MRTASKAILFFFVAALLVGGRDGVVQAAAPRAAEVPPTAVKGAACRAILWLHKQQKPDGGFGAGDRSSVSVTADVTYALALLGEDVTGPKWATSAGKDPLDALVALNAGAFAKADPGQAGKIARTVALAGGDPRNFAGTDLIGIIEDFHDPATGLYHPTFLFRHSLAIEGLLRSGAPVPQAAYDAVFASQLSDGGWFWSKNGTISDVDTTGRLLQVLGRFASMKAPTNYARAADYLTAQQLPEGGWNTGYNPDPSIPPKANANSTALAVGGLMAVGQDPQGPRFVKNGKGALETLLSFQRPTGEFVYMKDQDIAQANSIMATVDALSALAPLVEGQAVCGVRYLPLILVAK